jgi:hypothetical protein
MHPLLKALKTRGWIVETAVPSHTLLTGPLSERYPSLPQALVEFLSSLAVCANPEENSWFLTFEDYARGAGEGFRWNEYEWMALEALEGDADACAAVTEFGIVTSRSCWRCTRNTITSRYVSHRRDTGRSFMASGPNGSSHRRSRPHSQPSWMILQPQPRSPKPRTRSPSSCRERLIPGTERGLTFAFPAVLE